MAELAIAFAGAAIGGAIAPGVVAFGMTGASIGWAVGSTVASYLFAPDLPDIVGPRLGDLNVQSSALGAPIPKVYGTARIAGNVIWSEGIQEHRHEREVGGKGGGSQTQIWYTYTCSFAVGLCEGEIKSVRKIWADGKLIYDSTSGASSASILASDNVDYEIFIGTETQAVSSVIEAIEGTAETPAYRGLAYIVFEDLQLKDYGNRIPNITAEILTAGTSATLYSSDQATSTATGQLQNAHYISESGTYWIDCTLQDSNKQVLIKEMFWVPGASAIERRRWVHTFGVGNAWNPGTCFTRGHSDEPGYFIQGFSGAYPFQTYPIYIEPDGDQREWTTFGSSVTNTSIMCAKYSEFFYFAVYHAALIQIRCGDIVMILPSVLTGNTVTSIRCITTSSQYLFVLFIDSVLGQCVARYAHGNLYPTDYINITGFNLYAIAIRNASDVAYACSVGGVHQVRIHNNFASTYSESIILPDVQPVPATYVQQWNMRLFGDNGFLIWNGQSTGYTNYITGHVPITPSNTQLSSIVSDLCLDANLTAGDIDVTELTDNVSGYVRTHPMSARTAIEPLLQTYDAQGVESDWKLVFRKMDGAIDVSLTGDDVAAHEDGETVPDVLTITRQQEQELPRRIGITYIDSGRDYQQGHQVAQRIIT